MKKLLTAFAAATGLLLVVLVYERLLVEKTIGPAALASLFALLALFLSLATTVLLYDTRHRELVGKIWLAVLSTVASYVVLDLAAGFILIQSLSPQLVPDQYRHHKMLPNSRSSVRQRDFHYTQRINNFGMRGDDIAEVKPADSFRILMLGDSFTMGKGVEDQQSFPRLLEHALQQRIASCNSRRRVEVLNGGVDSYAPILSYLQLRQDFDRLKPDMVILNLDVSDLVQEAAYRRLAVYDASGNLVSVPQIERQASTTERIRIWVERHMFITRAALFYLIQRAGYREFSVRTVVEQANFATAAHTLANDTEPRESQWRAIFDSIGKIKSHTESRGAEFLLTVYPWGHQTNESEWKPGRYNFMPHDAVPSDKSLDTIRDLSQAGGINLVNLFPVFRAYRGDKALYFQYDPHWTPAGHEVMAQGLEQEMVKSHLDRWCHDDRGAARRQADQPQAARP
jgi:lysophospholipase L1-like esterase